MKKKSNSTPKNSETLPKQRTSQQNRALHLFFTKLADALNDAGLDQRKVLKPSYSIPWTPEAIKLHIWHPIQMVMYGTPSTTFLHKVNQIDHIHAVIMRELGQKYGVEFIPFPTDEEIQFNKLKYGK